MICCQLENSSSVIHSNQCVGSGCDIAYPYKLFASRYGMYTLSSFSL
jgi:hypothetical protein